MATIYHVTTRAEWEQAQQQGFYEAASLPVEGFIHASADERQVQGVLQRYFAGQSGLVKLTIDTSKLTHELKWELAPSVGEEFPHIYGPLNVEAVVSVEQLDS
ncbi:DUF952 domain-containing protein [Flaviaesturariibacter aridisoli]|uniref:DUF952 domain-containing protein n=1 Tax=Flaviaesturariibacter aridisoli TaxID=2545761 RepID=A0A4V2WME8_9BACT|nr:DUF952 domain-containing protein [Flaviaesturariibacter aridisoli]TCZ68398.1 DUF952 domain-containing protein [Flaviaesturariibacter aridisoli]